MVGQAKRVRAAGRRKVNRSIVSEPEEGDQGESKRAERALKSIKELTGTGDYEVGAWDLKIKAHRKAERR